MFRIPHFESPTSCNEHHLEPGQNSHARERKHVRMVLFRGMLAIQSRSFWPIWSEWTGLGAATYRQPPASLARRDFLVFFLLWQDFRSFNFVISKEWHVWLSIFWVYCILFFHMSGANWGLTVLLFYPWRSQIRVLWLCSVFRFGIVSDCIGLASLFWHGILWSVNEFLGSKDSGGMATPLLAMVQHNKVRDRQYWRKMADGVVTQP